MKKILLAVAIVVPFITFADSGSSNTAANSQQQQNFNAQKAKVSERIQKQITKMQQKLDKMQQAKACVDKATTKDAMKACKPSNNGKKNHK
ncbi:MULTISPECIES: hypothetical protein [unclassified Francisella]|uniref:hypothetical protein n=1 Tax=unclassified Francisella TaxID=2610885 RepID=UPI002E37D527|nr:MULTISPECIES: hypothetical protein [unclassified Francisella]MED7818752.1 hypothetical protein [Francisella sp. 19S2-4]MED7829531.1 hypothetical protein [Francisella sp. 19S2-10]